MSDFPKKRMLGYCSSCGVQVIDWKKEGKKASAKFKDNFREQIIELSNNTIMRVGLCEDCKATMVSGSDPLKVANTIVNNHIEYWKEHKREAPTDFENIKAVNPNTNLRQFLRKKEKLEQDKELNKMLSSQ